MRNSRYLPLRIKAIVYNACVRSTLLYGSESWAVNVSDVEQHEYFKNLFVENIAPRNLVAPSHAVRVALKLENNYKKTPQIQRLKWLGYVLRMREDKIANAAVEFVKIASWNNHQAVFVLRRAKSMKNYLNCNLLPSSLSKQRRGNNHQAVFVLHSAKFFKVRSKITTSGPSGDGMRADLTSAKTAR